MRLGERRAAELLGAAARDGFGRPGTAVRMDRVVGQADGDVAAAGRSGVDGADDVGLRGSLWARRGWLASAKPVHA